MCCLKRLYKVFLCLTLKNLNFIVKRNDVLKVHMKKFLIQKIFNKQDKSSYLLGRTPCEDIIFQFLYLLLFLNNIDLILDLS